MNLAQERHIAYDSIERYAMGKLADRQTVGLEEHLLWCESCREQLQQVDEFLHAFRLAAARLERDGRLPAGTSRGDRMRGFFGWAVPLPLAGILTAAILTLVLLAPGPKPPAGTAALSLTAMRDGSPNSKVTVASGMKLDLKLDLRGLPPAPRYDVEIAGERGNPLWRSQAQPSGDTLRVLTGRSLPSGSHWVRIYLPGGRELLREFGLQVR